MGTRIIPVASSINDLSDGNQWVIAYYTPCTTDRAEWVPCIIYDEYNMVQKLRESGVYGTAQRPIPPTDINGVRVTAELICWRRK
jgi:hypothetical protein